MSAITPDPVALAAATDIDIGSAERVLAWLAGRSTSVIGEYSAANTFVFDQEDPPQPPPDVQGLTPDQRYEDQGLLGRGGMGEVRRVYDRQLRRSIAMKILHKNTHRAVDRFLGEARVIAGLQHPGVLPVHEIGRLPDGRVYFTMQEIRGQTLRHHVREVHHATDNHWRATADGWTFRRLIAAFHAACSTIAYSHGEGMVHRDLKPQNIMVGAHDEVLVVDWGLARAAGSPGVPGRIVGTPAYLAPELLHTDCPPVDPRSDVYALGAVLYVILTNHSPFHGGDAQAIIEAVRQGPSPVPEAGLPLPEELIELCVRAMARDPNARIGHAGVLAVAVRTWLDGAHQREQAQALVTQARATLPEAAALRARA
ncbi:MAG: serine/threonine protein kinase, partial [Oligoflexia bacterium]|nr:serine/threonine protein kinase [Oligoflexia bacterium]